MNPQAAVSPPVSPLSPLTRQWRWRVFAATWLCYAGYYFCRKPFYLAKASLATELSFDATQLGTIGTAFLLAYAIGQFVSGALGDKRGPRVLLLGGMAVSIGANIGFGLGNSFGTFLGLMVLNGLAQATGWSGTVGTMASWFHRRERGTVMGLWATNFQVGGVLANTFAAWLLGAYGWRYSFVGGAAVLVVVWAFVLFNQRNRPEDLGLPAIDDPEGAPEPTTDAPWSRDVMINVALIGAFYFFLKLIRYALWSWAPFFLEKNFGLKGDEAGYLSTVFDVTGIAGVVVAGVLSDRLFRGRRATISFLFLIALVLATVALYTIGSSSVMAFAVCLGLAGFALYGPDALMTGAGAADVGSRRRAALAAGIINGCGSLGPIVQELVIGRLYDTGGGDLGPILGLLVGSAAVSLAFMAVILLRNRAGKADL
ncbi:MAG: MFS transporter [Pseudomonadota bacterium]|nr:MFS transporter [Pseudomonadota bacterium]